MKTDTMQPNMQKYQLNKDEMYALIDRAKMAVISTIGEDGYPYGTPINFVRIGDDIYFHGRKVGEKVSNLKANPRCCLTVVEENGFEYCGEGACNTTTLYESVIIRGQVEIVEDIECKKKILRATVDRAPQPPRQDRNHHRYSRQGFRRCRWRIYNWQEGNH